MSSSAPSLLEKPLVVQPADKSACAIEETTDRAVLSVTVSRSAAAQIDVDLLDDWQDDTPLSPAGNRAAAFLTIKRTINIVGALALLLLLSPAMLVTWLILVCTTKGPPIFIQERIGFLGKPFRMYKFRTMVVGAAAQQHAVVNHRDGPIFKNFSDPRITPVGRVLRSLSIDRDAAVVQRAVRANVARRAAACIGRRGPPVSSVAAC